MLCLCIRSRWTKSKSLEIAGYDTLALRLNNYTNF